MAQERQGDRGERFGMPTFEGMGALARKLDCSKKSLLRRTRDRIDPLWILRDPFGKRYAFVAAVEAWVQRRTLAIQTVELLEQLEAKAAGVELQPAPQSGDSESPTGERARSPITRRAATPRRRVPSSPMAKTNPRESRCK